jgi:6-phosphogluconolactonase
MSRFIHDSHGQDVRFYIGAYTNPEQTGSLKSCGIYSGSLNINTGHLGPVIAAGEAENPSFLTLSPCGKYLYAAIERPQGAVAAFRLNADGSLSRLNELPTGGAGCCHVSVDRTGRYIFAANYRGASVVAFRTGKDGSLEEQTAFIPINGSGPHPTRQRQSFGHSIYTDPTNNFAYACDLGSDNVWSFKFDSTIGTLVPHCPASGQVPAGSGPRHLAFDATGNFIYVCNELSSTVTVFLRKKDGTISPLQTVSLFPETVDLSGFGIAEISVHPSGKWLYISNRDISNMGRDFIATFSIDPDDRLTWKENTPAQVRHPRSFAIDPSGHYMIIAGQVDHQITVIKINPETEGLAPTGESIEVPAPACVLFGPSDFCQRPLSMGLNEPA